MRLSASVRAGLGIALCALLAANCVAAEKANTTSVEAPDGSSNSSSHAMPNVTEAPTTSKSKESPTPHVPVPSTTPNKTDPITTPNKTEATSSLAPKVATTEPTTKKTSTAATTNATVPSSPTSSTTSAATTKVSTASAALKNNQGFDMGSFIGGIVLTVGLLAVGYFGCRYYNNRRGVRYRTIDEHEAII